MINQGNLTILLLLFIDMAFIKFPQRSNTRYMAAMKSMNILLLCYGSYFVTLSTLQGLYGKEFEI